MNLIGKDKAAQPAESKSVMPSGMTFLLYCAGLSLISLVLYVIFSGKGFNFSAGEKGVEFKTALNREGVPSDPVARSEKSEQIREKFAEAAAAPQQAQPVKPARPSLAGKENREGGYAKRPAPEPAPVPAEPPAPEIASFNGTWTGNGSSYVIEQNGANIALIETTNGIATSYAQGVVNGKHATMTAVNISGVTFPIAVELEGKRIKLSAMGNSFFLDPQ